jgi:processive 1,2-diacylglycerol beta-glucosyltransferase
MKVLQLLKEMFKLFKILFLPFLQIPSGHQQAADALIARFESIPNIQCEKVDLFSYSYGRLEQVISRFYLKWIHLFPSSYSALYKKMVVKDREQDVYFYEFFFEKQLEQLLYERKPDCVICTHALPSRLLNKLKQKGTFDKPVLNVYTDFFIHQGWGTKNIDIHFVSTSRMKNYLMSKGIKLEQIFITGIPLHPLLTKKPLIPEPPRKKIHVLISGGSMGTGNLYELIQHLPARKEFHFFVLCGKNINLYRHLKSLNHSHLTPIPYIHSRKMMDCIYNFTDLIVTKPGGVTVSESLQKRIPIFIYDRLPGQEEINFEELQFQKLIHDATGWRKKNELMKVLLDFVESPKIIGTYYENIFRYEANLHPIDPTCLILNQLKTCIPSQ